MRRHERFVLAFLKDGNATRAYVRAGYSARGAQPSASRLLRRPHIAAAVATGRQRIAAALELSVERIGREYARIAFANIDDYIQVEDDSRLRIDLEKASRAQHAGISEMRGSNHSKPQQQVTLKLNKLQALAGLTDRMGLFAEQPEPVPPPTNRARYEYPVAKLAEDCRHTTIRLIEAEQDRDTARAMLADAQARLAAAVPTPSPSEPSAAPDMRQEKKNHSNPWAMRGPEVPPPHMASAGHGAIFRNTAHQPPSRFHLAGFPALGRQVPGTIANHSNRDLPLERRGPKTADTPYAIALPARGERQEASLNPAP